MQPPARSPSVIYEPCSRDALQALTSKGAPDRSCAHPQACGIALRVAHRPESGWASRKLYKRRNFYPRLCELSASLCPRSSAECLALPLCWAAKNDDGCVRTRGTARQCHRGLLATTTLSANAAPSPLRSARVHWAECLLCFMFEILVTAKITETSDRDATFGTAWCKRRRIVDDGCKK